MDLHFKIELMKCVIVAGPKETTQSFLKWAFDSNKSQWATKKSIFVTIESPQASREALSELLRTPEIACRIDKTKAATEVLAISKYYKVAGDCPQRVCYGAGPVSVALEHMAVDILIISDNLLRSQNIRERTFWSNKVQTLPKTSLIVVGGAGVNASRKIRIARLQCLTTEMEKFSGIAGILRFPLHELEELDPLFLPTY